MKSSLHSRRVLMWAAGGICVLLTGCTSPGPGASLEPQDSYCYRYKHGTPPYNKARYRVCTTHAVPSMEVDAQAKRFEASPSLATVYVVRNGWGDTSYRVPIKVDGATQVDTVPRSMVRILLTPGSHALDFEWQGTRVSQPLKLGAGDVRFVRLEASGWPLGTQFNWTLPEAGYAQDLAVNTRLVADLRLP